MSEPGSVQESPELRELRKLVDGFAIAMAERLRVNREERGKWGWQYLTPKQLLRRAETELRELRRAVEKNRPAQTVTREAADVGNFCAMLASVYGRRSVSGGTPE